MSLTKELVLDKMDAEAREIEALVCAPCTCSSEDIKDGDRSCARCRALAEFDTDY